jgi:hypothetical protein
MCVRDIPLGHDFESPSLRFDSHQDALYFAAKSVQDSKDWLARNDRNFVDRYRREEIEIVVPLRIRDNERPKANQYHLIFNAIPNVRIRHGKGATVPANGRESALHDLHQGRDEFVFIPVTQFVQCPQEVIASSVRLEPAKQRLNLLREVCGSPYGASHLGNIPSEREGSIFRARITVGDGDCVASIVQSAPEVHDNIACDIRKGNGKWLRELDLVYLPVRFLRVWLDNLFVGIETVETHDSLVEIGQEIVLSPCEFAARTDERV